jgi:hypothetical protein
MVEKAALRSPSRTRPKAVATPLADEGIQKLLRRAAAFCYDKFDIHSRSPASARLSRVSSQALLNAAVNDTRVVRGASGV